MNKDRYIVRRLLEEGSPFDLVELLDQHGFNKKLDELTHDLADYIARHLDEIALKNYLADNVGYEDYQKLSKLKSKDIKESEGSIWMLIN